MAKGALSSCLQCCTNCNTVPPATSNMATREPQNGGRALERVYLNVFGAPVNFRQIRDIIYNNMVISQKHGRETKTSTTKVV